MPYNWKQELYVVLTLKTIVMLLKHRICNGQRDMWPFLMILGMKLIKKKESSSVYYAYWQYLFWIICYNKSIIVRNIAKRIWYLHHGMACPQAADGGTASNRRVAAKILNKTSLTADKGWYSNLGLGWDAKNSSP